MKFDLEKYPIYSIVADGGISIPEIGEGRFFPYLIIDAENDSKISQLINLHRETPPGDTDLLWTGPPSLFTRKEMILKIGFKKPMQTTFGIAFNLSNQYSLLDGVIQSRGFFLQIGKTGDKVSTTIKNASILVEVPFMDFDKKWNEMLFDIVKSKFKKDGASKKEATIFATQHIKSMREVWNTRRDN
ncbi:hypothetical protein [Flavobacterium filum]|uniref:hypothetical protein n=1 Tax=Flavobacterium filum TaxID=370974 RepID=UPI0023F03F11|nr:hypothetical protein [Flavobacterium filum]